MAEYKIALLPGDGVGPEIIREGVKVLDATASKFDLKLQYENYDWGGERYLATGVIIPEGGVEELKQFDAIYLGAVGHPEVPTGVLEKQLLLALRFALDQYINLRPVKLYPHIDCPLKDKGPEDIDYVVVRENTEDAYAGIGGSLKTGTPDEVATQLMIYTRKGTERCIRYAFELARRRNKDNKVTLVDKANVLTHGHGLWRRTFAEVATEYPDIKAEYAFVDACCMWMVKNPEWFDVIVTTNLFGDIITDLAAMTQGGLGVAAGGNINPDKGGVSMFEPIHGSAPKYTGLNKINPLATILAGAMMLNELGSTEAAKAIEDAVVRVLESGKMPSMQAGSGWTTSQVGDWVAEEVTKG